MKMSSDKNATIISMMAANGSSTQPSGTEVSARSNQRKLQVSRKGWALKLVKNATHESNQETATPPMASEAASRRRSRLSNAPNPAMTSSGSAGINHRYWTTCSMTQPFSESKQSTRAVFR